MHPVAESHRRETVQDKLDPKLWTEFDRVVEQGDAPKVSIETLKVIRNATPVERLAGWLMKAWFPLFLIFLGFLLLHEHSSPTEIARVALVALVVSLLVTPLLGRRPSARPIALGLVGMLGIGLSTLLDWPTRYLLMDPKQTKSFDLFTYALFYQRSIESLGDWPRFLPILFLLIGLPFVVGWLTRRYYWLSPKTRWSRWHLAVSLLLMIGPALALAGGSFYLHQATQRLDWIAGAEAHNPYGVQTLSKRDECTLKPQAFKALELKEPEMIRSMLRELSAQAFNQALGELNDQISDPSFQPTEEDMVILSFISFRATLKGDPTPQSERFAWESWKLTNRLKALRDIGETEQLLEDQVVPKIVSADTTELDSWSIELKSNPPFEVSRQDIDSLVLEQIRRRNVSPEVEKKPVEFLGIAFTGRSLAGYVVEYREKACLLDYTLKRRTTTPDGGSYRDYLLEEPARFRFWSKFDIEQSYKVLNWKMNPEVLERSHRLLRTFVALRRSKLETGVYPETLPDFAPPRLVYESRGTTASVRKDRPDEDGGPIEWTLR